MSGREVGEAQHALRTAQRRYDIAVLADANQTLASLQGDLRGYRDTCGEVRDHLSEALDLNPCIGAANAAKKAADEITRLRKLVPTVLTQVGDVVCLISERELKLLRDNQTTPRQAAKAHDVGTAASVAVGTLSARLTELDAIIAAAPNYMNPNYNSQTRELLRLRAALGRTLKSLHTAVGA